jgi:hypothetical protein
VKGQKNRGEGVRSFIDVESGTGPVYAPCPKRGVAELRSADQRTEICNTQNNYVYNKRLSFIYF